MSSDTVKASALVGSVLALGAGVAAYVWKRPPTKPISSKAASIKLEDKAISGELEKAFPRLLEDFLAHTRTAYGFGDESIARLKRMLVYNCVGGKMNRAVQLVQAARDVAAARGAVFDQTKLQEALALGWCVEILQACFLVSDDVMDKSETRRGQPCWYKLPEIQFDAINDALILESWIYFILKQHFHGQATYVPLFELFHEVAYQTQLGQMTDLVSNPQGRERGPGLLNTFNLDLYKRIVHYKTAFYTFYLSFAAALILVGETNSASYEVMRRISIELGEKFQIQDDWLDCFGDPQLIGKVGTDIQDHKCSWLVVQALLRVTAAQRRLLEENYGQKDEACVQRVKDLYKELKLAEVYDQQEEDSYKRILKIIDEAKNIVPPAMLTTILNKIHRRQK